MSAINILWVDDEVELLRPHIIFLEKRGYQVDTATNADDALDMLEKQTYDLLFLDEMMPGLGGLDALGHIKKLAPEMPIVMITKSEEEDIMDRAVGAKIADYLIKPVNPNQVLISIKKCLHQKELVKVESTAGYQSDYSQLAEDINKANTFGDFTRIYQALCDWRLTFLDAHTDQMLQLQGMQQEAANAAFAKFIRRNYVSWFPDNPDRPLMSPQVLSERVFPLLDAGEHVLLVVIDNLRYDQWLMMRSILSGAWRVEQEEMYCAILPSVTQYARNSLFAGLMPLEIARLHPDLWVGELDEEGKNQYEFELLERFVERTGRDYALEYFKGASLRGAGFIGGNVGQLLENDLTVVVYNFIDMLSHARSDMQIMKQLAQDANAYLSLTKSWFQHSDLYDFLMEAAALNVKLVITTDHGSIQVRQPVRVVGDRETSTNMRYKMGRNLAYNWREVIDFKQPALAHLPQANVSSRYIFAVSNQFLVYPNNFAQIANRFRDSFQHGGVSMEEMLVPLVTLNPQR